MEINEYVRTKDGKIGKYIQPDLGKPYITNGISFDEGANYGKHSKDIIDLIEVGDYVNGSLVLRIDYRTINGELNPRIYTTDQEYWCGGWGCMEYDYTSRNIIKSVLTHEQFEANAYTIEKEK